MKKLLRSEYLIFSIIFLFSLVFRVTNLDLIEFKTDEAVNLLLSSRPALHQSLPPGGTVSSIGILNPPLFNYLLTPLTFFTLDPKFFSLFIALVNALSIAFFYLIVKKYYGQIIAFTSSVLFAFSPWAILYSRKIWNQDLLVPFFILMFYSLHKIISDKKNIFWLTFALSSVFLIQLHQASFLFIALILLFIWLQKIKINIKYVLIGTILGLIPLLPYMSYEVKYGYPDFKALFSSQQRLSSERSISHLLRPMQITGQGNFAFILGADLDTFIKRFPIVNIVRKIFYIEYILLIIGSLIFLKKFTTFRFFAYSSILLPFVYFILKIDPFMHYYIVTLPLLFLFLGAAFEFLLKRENKLLKALSISLFLSLVTSSFVFNFYFFRLLSDQGRFQGDYGDSLKNSENHINYTNYNELFLAQFIPLNYSFGYNPFAKMVYKDTAVEQIPFLEEKLQKSDDPRIEQRLLAFYTKEPTTLGTLDTLRKKTREIPAYNNIYKETLNDYLAINYKKEYISDKFDLRFFYPQHWRITDNNDEIILKGDYLYVEIKKENNIEENSNNIYTESQVEILRQNFKKVECRKKNNIFCGEFYLGRSTIIKISILPLDFSSNKAEAELNAARETVRSFRFNN